MILKSIINKAYYGTIGHISSIDDLNLLERYIVHNLPVLKEYKGIIVATNYKDLGLAVKNAQLWLKYFPECKIIDLKENRGHNFGTADLDNALFNYCKNNNIEWLCKSANDIILTPELLDLNIQKSDFYFLKSVGYGGMEKCNFDFNVLKDQYFPQTNFYFINVSKVDYLNDEKYLDETYNQIQNIPNYNGKVWEYIKNWTCERFLQKCIDRNKLSKYHLVSPKKYIILLNTIKNLQIHDCSHKNILINGVCHFHYPNKKIIKI